MQRPNALLLQLQEAVVAAVVDVEAGAVMAQLPDSAVTRKRRVQSSGLQRRVAIAAAVSGRSKHRQLRLRHAHHTIRLELHAHVTSTQPQRQSLQPMHQCLR